MSDATIPNWEIPHFHLSGDGLETYPTDRGASSGKEPYRFTRTSELSGSAFMHRNFFDKPPTCIVVMGMHRSGTSLLTKVLNILGVRLSAKLLGPTDANKKGHWESELVYDLNQRFLRDARTSWQDWTRLDSTPASAMARDELIQQAILYLRAEFTGVELFALKDPRFSRLLPNWEAAFGATGIETKIVVCVRNPLDVAASLSARSGIPAEAAHFLWLRYMLEAEFHSRRLHRVFVNYDKMLTNWSSAIAEISNGLEIEFSEATIAQRDEIGEFIDPELRHHAYGDKALSTDKAVHPWVRRTYRLLQQLPNSREGSTIYRELDKIRSEFNSLSSAARPYVAEAVENELRANRLEHLYITEKETALQKHAQLGVLEEQKRQEIEKLQDTLSEISTKAEQLQQELDAAHVQQSKTALDAEEALHVSERKNSNIIAQLAEAERSLAEMDRQLKEIQQELFSAHAGHSRTELVVSSLETTLKERNEELEGLRTDLVSARSQLELATGNLAHLQENSAKLLEEIEEGSRALQAREKELEQSDVELKRLTGDLNAAERKIEEQGASIFELEEHSSTQALRVANLELQRERHLQFVEESIGMVTANVLLRGRLEESEEKHKNAQAEIIRLVRAEEETRRDFESRLQTVQEGLNAALDENKAALARQLGHMEHLKSDLHITKLESQSVRSNFEALKRKNSAFEYLNSMERRAREVAQADLLTQAKMYKDSSESILDFARDNNLKSSTIKQILTDLVKKANAPLFSRDEIRVLINDIENTGLFDRVWYDNAYPELRRLEIDPLFHYTLIGNFEGRDPNSFFSTNWYRLSNPDMGHSENPLVHFSRKTKGDRAFPNPLFDADYYLDNNSDVEAAGFNPLAHFLQYGFSEGRRINGAVDLFSAIKEVGSPSSDSDALRRVLELCTRGSVDLPGVDREVVHSLRESEIFDTAFYLRHAPEVTALSADPIYDYLVRGWRLNKQPNLMFDTSYYLEQYPDVAASGINPFFHFIRHGAAEGRAPHPLFDTKFYFSEHPDIKEAMVNPILHYARHGWKPSYSPSPYFDASWYIQTYNVEGRDRFNPLVDYLSVGRNDGRRPHPDFDPDFYEANSSEFKNSGYKDPFLYFLKFGFAKGQIQTSPGKYLKPAVSSSPENHPSNIGNFAQGTDVTKIAPAATLPAAPSINVVDHWYAPNWEKSIPLLREIGDEIKGADDLPRDVLKSARELLQANPFRISVVMPAWNRAKVIEAAINSVLQQTYSVHELIVVDDGSTDNTVSMVRERFAKEIAQKKLIFIARSHEGLCATRNAGLAAATGDLVAYLDSDNTWHQHYSLLMGSLFAASPALGTAYCAENYHDADRQSDSVVGERFDRPKLLNRNFIDLNCFVHRRSVAERLGGFDTEMTRLVDWELIIRYTRFYPPAFVPVSLVEYYLDRWNLNNVTYSENWQSNWAHVVRKHHKERVRYGVVPMRVAYVIWDWPALSQTFVLNELRWLILAGIDVRVYFKTTPDLAATLDFDVSAEQVETAEILAEKLIRDKRTVMHSPFAYPATTLLTWPAARTTGIPFTFMPGGVDISHFENRRRNRVGEVASDPLCLGVITLGKYHRSFLAQHGVPMRKIVMERQAVGLPARSAKNSRPNRPRIISIGRFIEKKGFGYLVQAAHQLADCDIFLYGYGPLEKELREQAAKLKLANFHFKGSLDGTVALHEAYSEADLFVLPCVEAANGDMDGLPTVLLEAMAAGVPVVTTRLANIPDLIVDGVHGFLAEPANPDDLTATIKRALSIGPSERSYLIQRAETRAREFASDERMMRSLLTIWQSRSIDVVLVTYDTPEYNDVDTTIEIIDRVYAHTVLPFNLIVVDNRSQASFLDRLEERYGNRNNFNLVRLPKNVFVGPGTNIGIEAGVSEYVVYLCSKEGFILQNGWDLAVVNAMDANPRAGLGGYKISVPKFGTAEHYTKYPSFTKWRNQEFALRNPDRVMRHLQGGLLVLRRSTYELFGGFNDDVPHDGTDLEYSYYLESCGVELLDIADIYSVSAKTWPGPETLIDGNALAMHALTSTQADEFSAIINESLTHCNICDSAGVTFSDAPNHKCSNCGSSPFDRSSMRHLSLSGFLQERPKVTCLDAGEQLIKALLPICSQAKAVPSNIWDPDDEDTRGRSPAPILIVDLSEVDQTMLNTVFAKIHRHARQGGPVVFTGSIELVAGLTSVFCDDGIAVAEIGSASDITKLEVRPIRVSGFENIRELKQLVF